MHNSSRIDNTRSIESAAADSGAARMAANAPDTFTASSDPIHKLEQERLRLATQLEKQHGKLLTDLRNKHAKTQQDLARFKQAQAMDVQTWAANLDCVLAQLEKPESLTPEKRADLENWALALSAKDMPPDQNRDAKLLVIRNKILKQRPLDENRTFIRIPDDFISDFSKSVEKLRRSTNLDAKTRIRLFDDIETNYEHASEANLSVTDRRKVESLYHEAKIRIYLAEQSAELERQQKQIPLELLRQLTNVEAQLELYRSEERERDLILDQAQRERATLGYQERAEKIKLLSTETRKLALQHQQEKTPLTEEKLKQVQLDFRKALHDLEEWDLQAKTARNGADPYSSSNSLTSTTELVREFQLARHGVNNIRDAYKALFGTAAENFSLSELWKSISLDELKKRLEEAKNLARDYPLECADLAANLAHAWSILNSTGAITDDLRTVLYRQEMANYVKDAILGQQAALYSTGELKPISLEKLALIHLCSWAPEIAGVLMQESMLGAKAARFAASNVPVIGSMGVTQLAAGTTAALLQVQAQRYAAARLSRDCEVMANTLRVGLEGYKNGGYAGAMRDAAAYASTRQLVQNAGNIFRAAVENRLTDELLSGWRQAPVTEAAKTVVAAGLGWGTAAAALGTAVATTGGVLTAPIWGSVVATGFAVGVVAKVGSDFAHNWFKSSETKLSEQQQKTAERLAAGYSKLKAERTNLPSLDPHIFQAVAKADKPEDVLTQIIDAKLVAEEQVFYASLAPSTNIPPKTIEAVVRELPPVLPDPNSQ
jgi:hypothetical protein